VAPARKGGHEVERRLGPKQLKGEKAESTLERKEATDETRTDTDRRAGSTDEGVVPDQTLPLKSHKCITV